MVKKTTIISLMVLFCGCESATQATRQPEHDDKVWLNVKDSLKGIEIVHLEDQYDAFHGRYNINVMVRNHNKKPINISMDAHYLDVKDKEIAQSTGGPDHTLASGDSAVFQNSWIFPTKNDLPYSVNLSFGILY